MGAFNADDRQALINMFVAAQGKWACFRVFDPTDYFVTNEPLAPPIGSSTPVQLVRNYAFPGSNVYGTALIQAPVASTVVINKDGSPVDGTLNDQLGLFTPSSPWAPGTFTWTGQYDRWMRFDSDWGAFTANALNAFTADIDLVEVQR
ncbi:DUF2460 domain-containing protein [Lysobacter enzymogenes]|nr:DUF2460 domain-containing protein [Lysobacter enzymogenes]QQP96484.1 DUF2460 domain-containing protein [Lysobacter enzymogenes]